MGKSSINMKNEDSIVQNISLKNINLHNILGNGRK
jgi:hypothetical protein